MNMVSAVSAALGLSLVKRILPALSPRMSLALSMEASDGEAIAVIFILLSFFRVM